ncbi:hypothetical protein LZQ00_05735 [Sphingobacterium sp. SRCM116780]|uniref:hypothetical protein n=1 Tax=Sphingobacterium sp. SRCM116780 TaxID=2907623 RepID=UPI001F47304B|nr:hypothetical protein [Sphingobacterium sp. SRCM116780]UIR57315.1 hypothetical protein LZQ00_05735 [Sphingobacterium sp. SRCM116780]
MIWKKRYILTPKTVEIANKLDQDLASSEELIEIVLTEDDYNGLEKLGFFSFLNDLVNVNIDDYEDEVIVGDDHIRKVLSSIDSFDKANKQKSLLNEIRELFREALIRKTGVYFYF